MQLHSSGWHNLYRDYTVSGGTIIFCSLAFRIKLQYLLKSLLNNTVYIVDLYKHILYQNNSIHTHISVLVSNNRNAIKITFLNLHVEGPYQERW